MVRYVNIFWHPRAGEFEGRDHASTFEASVAARWELAAEPEATLLRTEARDGEAELWLN